MIRIINPDCLQGYEFINKFALDIQNLEKCGFEKKQIIKMLCALQYVKDFADTPEWFVSVAGLPKGYKWTDGIKYNSKCKKRESSETYIFLEIKDDLYIKGFFSGAHSFVCDDDNVYKCYRAPKEFRNKICVIKNWRKYKVQYVLYKLSDTTPFFDNSITDFWYKNGGDISMIENRMIRDLKE